MWKSFRRSNLMAWLLIILLTWYLLISQFFSFLLDSLVKKFLVSNYIKSFILYWGTGRQCWLIWRLSLAYAISMLSCKIFWISSICVAKVSMLTFFILLERDLAGLKPMWEWNPLFIKKRNTFVISDLVLLLMNFAKGS